MTTKPNNPKTYPVKFVAPNPVQLPVDMSDGQNPVEGRQLNTYVKDWLTLDEFDSLMPGHDIVRFMAYEAVGPEGWTIHIHAEEVLSCERDRAMQTIFINAMRQEHLSKAHADPADIREMARGYGEISPDAVLFLMRLHEFMNEPEDNFQHPDPPDAETLAKADEMMTQNGVTMRDLMK